MVWSSEGSGRSLEFIENRPWVLDRDGYQCQLAFEVCIGTATEVDHRVNRASLGGDAMENLQAVCVPCHKEKTQQEAIAARRRNRLAAIHPDHRRKHPGYK